MKVHVRVEFYNQNHEKASGRFTSGAGGSRGSSIHTSKGRMSVDKAIEAIAQGRSVTVKTEKSAATLVHRLGQEVLKLTAKGDKAPNYNLCKVSVPGTNLFCGKTKGIERQSMPQLGGFARPGSKASKLPKTSEGGVDASEEFTKHLRRMGVKVTTETVKASQLKATQNELNGRKIAGMVANRKFHPENAPIFVSRDGYVIDGHHRWAAQIARDLQDGHLGDKTLNVHRVDMDIMTVLKEANKWTKAFGIESAGV